MGHESGGGAMLSSEDGVVLLIFDFVLSLIWITGIVALYILLVFSPNIDLV